MTGNLNIWLTPVWLLSVGVTLGAVVLVLLYGILWLISRPAAATALRVARESVLQWISYVVLGYIGFCLLATPMMPLRQVIASLSRVPYVGTKDVTVEVPPRTDDFDVPIRFHADELQQYSLRSEQDVVVTVEPDKAYSDPLILVVGAEPYVWTPSS
jgi:hypothetical protein